MDILRSLTEFKFSGHDELVEGPLTETHQLGSRGIYVADLEQSLSYGIFDADHHLYAPSDATSRYLSAEMIERAWLPGEPRMLTEEEHEEDEELDHERRTLGVHSQPEGGHGGVDINELPAMEGSIPPALRTFVQCADGATS